MSFAPRFTITHSITMALTAIEHLLESGRIDIRDYEALCPGVSRRTLQRDLSVLEAKRLVRHEGETNKLVYLPRF